MDFEKDKQLKDDIIQNHKNLLKRFSDDKVVTILSNGNEFELLECCDQYYGHTLTREECEELSLIFKEIAKRLNTE